ncbi:hypothetical protein diail_8604 [Diaporthe ilicicola]|nr:hypothetical protein diail_8604 [Diaporthe ilicicola]
MKGTYAAVGALATLIGQAQANSDMVSLYTNGNAYIQEASATLVLPSLPGTVSGDVAIWSAIMMENEASFLQGVTSNSPSGSYCNDKGLYWCNFAYTLVGSTPTVGDPVTASPGSTVRTHYKLNPSTQLWDQDVYIDGKLSSNISTTCVQARDNTETSSTSPSSAPPAAAPLPRPTVRNPLSQVNRMKQAAADRSIEWEDVSIVLSEADQSFGHTGNWSFGATGGAMSTSDNGKTWNFTTISVPSQKAQ